MGRGGRGAHHAIVDDILPALDELDVVFKDDDDIVGAKTFRWEVGEKKPFDFIELLDLIGYARRLLGRESWASRLEVLCPVLVSTVG